MYFRKKGTIVLTILSCCVLLTGMLVFKTLPTENNTQTGQISSSNTSSFLESWTGEYSFSEFCPPNQNMFFSITIYRENSHYLAKISVDGFQTLKRLSANVVGDENSIRLEFLEYLPENIYEIYNKGDILLEFKRENSKLITVWGKIGPLLIENDKPGVYFKKES